MKKIFTLLTFLSMTVSAFAANVYWVGSSDNANPGDWATATNWNTAADGSGTAQAPNTTSFADAVFSQNAAVSFASAPVGIVSLTVNNNATVRFMTAGTVVLFNTLPPALNIALGAKLELSATVNALNQPAGTAGGPNLNIQGTSTIAGTLDAVCGSNSRITQAFSASNIINVSGTIRFGNLINTIGGVSNSGTSSISGTLNMNANSNMLITKTFGSTIPAAIWNTTSTLTINDLSAAANNSAMSWSGSAATSLGNFVWNCPNQANPVSTGFQTSSLTAVTTVKGDMTITSSNGKLVMMSANNSNSSTTTFKGNFTSPTTAQIDMSNSLGSSNSGSPTWIFEKNVAIAGPLNNGTATNSGTYTIQFKGSNTGLGGSGAQTFSCGAITAGKIRFTVNNTGNNVELTSNIGTVGNVTLSNGKVILGNFNLTSSGSATGSSSAGYVVTDGTGVFTLKSVPAYNPVTFLGGRSFPVGVSTSSYDPVLVLPTNSVDFTVSVKTSFTNPILDATKAVAREWNITATGAGSTALSLEASILPSGGAPGAGLAVFGHYTAGAWAEYGSTSYAANAWTFVKPDGVFSPFGVGTQGAFSPTPLSVEFTTINAQAKGTTNVVNFATATEKDVKEFAIERSTDNKTWATIGTKAPIGGTTAAAYSFVDNTPTTLAYYRVRSVEVSGNGQTSKAVAVKRNGGKLAILSVFPMPYTEGSSVDFSIGKTTTVSVTITDIVGRVVKSEIIKTVEGANNARLNLSNLSSGTYILTMNDGETTATQRVVKQ